MEQCEANEQSDTKPGALVATPIPQLRLITYLSPSLPLGLYQTYQRYLEEALGCECFLMVESRWSAPPPGRDNPFTSDSVDIGEIDSTGLNV